MFTPKIGCRYLWRNHWVTVWILSERYGAGCEIWYDGTFDWIPRNELEPVE